MFCQCVCQCVSDIERQRTEYQDASEQITKAVTVANEKRKFGLMTSLFSFNLLIF